MKTNRGELFEILSVVHDYNINPLTRTIYIGGWPGDFDEMEVGVNHQMAMEFIRNITFLESQGPGPILVHMCTIGGEYEYGMAIYDAIKMCKCPTTIIAHAHARSMSSIVLQAADRRVMMPDCLFMIHEGTIEISSDTVKGAKSYMELAEKDVVRMLEVYTERCKPSADFIRMKMDLKQEWYLTAPEAVAHGFADEVYRG